MTDTTQSPAASLDTGFFGHPKGLQTLFITEMWERMSYYGMRGLLVLFMTTLLADGGMGLNTATATAIYGLYTAAVYFMGLPGGWLADRLIGSQKAIWYGGIVIMCGHIVLAIPSHSTFYIGLILVALGTGLLKPNITAVVGQLYRREDPRRDAGYALYYMGINIGAVIGYTVSGYLGEQVGWHYGFGSAAVGMGLGLLYFRWTETLRPRLADSGRAPELMRHFRHTRPYLGEAGKAPAEALSEPAQRQTWLAVAGFLALVVLVTALLQTGMLTVDAVSLSEQVALVFTAIFLLYFFGVYLFGALSRVEKRGMWALFLVCIASACFWSGFEQAGSSLNLFGREYTDRFIGAFEMPATWLQNFNPLFIILLTPFFAAMWIKLGQQMITPGYGLKSAIGLMIMGSGFLVMVVAAGIASEGSKAPAYLLILTYFLHTVGELCLSPVALSAVSKLAPQRYLGQMMGLFILTYSLGNIIAGLVASRFNFDPESIGQMPNLFLQIALFTIGVGAAVYLIGLATRFWEKEVVEQHGHDDGGGGRPSG